MTSPAKIAADALKSKALELLEERVGVRRRLLENAIRDQQIERDLGGCVAGSRALGYEIDLPTSAPLSPPKLSAMQQFLQARNSIAGTFAHLKTEFDVSEEDESAASIDVDPDLKPEMPRIADIIVDRLSVSGNDGSKAADIRRYILLTYNADIHEKTVGMTLYRLQKDGVVHREGHTWFLSSAVAEKKNPGVAAPGSNHPSD